MEHLTLTPGTDFRELFKPSDVYSYCGCCPCCGCVNDCYELDTDIRADIERLNFVSTIKFLFGFLGCNQEDQELVWQYVSIVPLTENARFDRDCDPNDAKVSTLNGSLQTEIVPGHYDQIEMPDSETATRVSRLLRSGEWQVVYDGANEWAWALPRNFIDIANDFAEELRYFAVNGSRRPPFITGSRTKAALRDRQIILDNSIDESVELSRMIDTVDNSIDESVDECVCIASIDRLVVAIPTISDNLIDDTTNKPTDKMIINASTNIPSLNITIDLSDLEL